MDERSEHRSAVTGGGHDSPRSASPKVLAEVVQFPDLIGERRKASCAVIRDELGSTPDFRMEKVHDAQEKIDSRFYERPEVLAKLMERLLAEMRASTY